jgi:hypothetical protein
VRCIERTLTCTGISGQTCTLCSNAHVRCSNNSQSWWLLEIVPHTNGIPFAIAKGKPRANTEVTGRTNAPAHPAKKANSNTGQPSRSTSTLKRKIKVEGPIEDSEDEDNDSVSVINIPAPKKVRQDVTVSGSRLLLSDAIDIIGGLSMDLMAMERTVQGMRTKLADFAAAVKGDDNTVLKFPVRK